MIIMSKIYNALAMLDILSSKRKYTIKELSEKLELSPRMVRYYKEELEKLGYYIESTTGVDGGYQLISDVYLPKINVSKYDLELLNGVVEFLDKNNYPFKEELDTFVNKVQGIYMGSQKKYVSYNTIENSSDKEKYEIFNDAIKNNKRVEISYLSLKNTISERVIQPCEIFRHKTNFYVAAYCELRGEIRHFEFQRINTIKVL